MTSKPHYEGDPDPNNTTNVIENDKQVIIVKPKGLNIVWGMDDRYWALPKESDKPAELLQVCWLEVTGAVETAAMDKKYEVAFKISLAPDAFGWGASPIYVMAKWGKNGKFSSKKHFLRNIDTQPKYINTILHPLPSDKVSDMKQPKLYFGLYEVWSGKWKGGLRIHEVTIRELDK